MSLLSPKSTNVTVSRWKTSRGLSNGHICHDLGAALGLLMGTNDTRHQDEEAAAL